MALTKPRARTQSSTLWLGVLLTVASTTVVALQSQSVRDGIYTPEQENRCQRP